MEQRTLLLLDELSERYPCLSACKEEIRQAYNTLVRCFENGNRLYICGNGGSAADALHIVGELMKSFVAKRKVDAEFVKRLSELFPNDTDALSGNLQGALPAYALVENTALSTAFSNDEDAGYVFAQQAYGYIREGDVLLGISTSGNSENIIRALKTAKAKGGVTIGLSGDTGGRMKSLCDVCICVPETETYKIQELHLPIYHTLCLMLEVRFWGTED
jgi:D-sedoheptulose 7-phosphate isomerase